MTAKSTSVSSLTRGSSRCSRPGRAAVSSFSSTSVIARATESAVLRASDGRHRDGRRRGAGQAWQHGQGALTRRDRGWSRRGSCPSPRRRASSAPTPHVMPTTSAAPDDCGDEVAEHGVARRPAWRSRASPPSTGCRASRSRRHVAEARLDLLAAPLTPSGAGSENADRREQDQHAEHCPQPAQWPGGGLHLQELRLGPRQRRHDAHGDRRLDEAEEEQVLERHRRHRHAKLVGRVERLAARRVGEVRLDAELDPGRSLRPRWRRRRRRRRRDPARRRRRVAAEEAVQVVADERDDHGHVEAVGGERRDAAVAEEAGLDHEGDGDRDHRGPRAEDDRDQGRAYGVAGRPADDRHVEHHDDEREGGAEARAAGSASSSASS